MDKLQEAFYSPKTGFRDAKFYEPITDLSRKEIQDWINKQQITQINAPPPEAKYIHIVNPQLGNYQADLTFFTQYKNQNNGYHILLTAIEITSRKAYVIPMKTKTADSVVNAFEKLILQINNHREKGGWKQTAYRIKSITTDLGSEFISKKFKDLMEKHQVTMYFAEPGDKHRMGLIERFNRTFRELIEKYLTANNTFKFIDVLDDLVENYNSKIHSTINATPNSVNVTKAKKIYDTLVEENKEPIEEYNNIIVGDKVRHIVKKETFGKGKTKYSAKVYEVEAKPGYRFKLKGIERLFGRSELKKIGEYEERPTIDRTEVRRENTTNRRIRKEDLGEVVDLPKRISKRVFREGEYF